MSNQESKDQKKIFDFLEGKGFHVIRNVAASKSGESDIIACSPKGQFWAVEVKTIKVIVSKLQAVKQDKILAKGGIAFIAFGYEDFLFQFKRHYK